MVEETSTTVRDGGIETEAVNTDAVDEVEIANAWAKHESPLCETCKTVLNGYDLATSVKQAANLWNALDGEDTEESYGHQLLTSDKSLISRAADGCHLCKAFLDQISEDNIEGMRKYDSLVAGGERNCADVLTYRQDLDLLIFLSRNGQMLPSLLELQFNMDEMDGPSRYEYRIEPRMLVVQNEGISNLPTEMEANTGSDTTFSLVDRWMLECLDTHDCHASWAGFEKGFYPTYLINVGDTAPPKPRLCRGEEARAQTFRYLTISHCWGHSQPVKLMKENLEGMMEGIDYNTLPKTFQDAISVVQRMRQRYIWIDSLCIVQNSAAIWLRESAAMGQIYSNSICNISATAASDNEGGLFYDRDPSSVKHVVTQIKNGDILQPCSLYPRYFWDYNMKNAPLNQRAWVCQERLLSTCNLHFAAEQVFWECRSKTACESAPDSVPEVFLDAYIKRDMSYYLALTEPIPTDAPVWESAGKFWSIVTDLYTPGELSFAKDKLVAISGLAAQMYKLANDEYLAGLWRTNMMDQLLWFPMDDVEFPEPADPAYVAPSWSWASCRGRIGGAYVPSTPSEPVADIVSAQVELASPNPFGQVKGGHLIMSGKLAKAVYRTFMGEIDLLPGTFPNSLHIQADDAWALEIAEPIAQQKLLGVSWSLSRERVMAQRGVVYLLPCVRNKLQLPGQAGPGYDQLEGLVLVATGRKAGEFYRCGKFSVYAVSNDENLKLVDRGCRYFDAHCAENGLEYSEDEKRGLVYTVTII